MNLAEFMIMKAPFFLHGAWMYVVVVLNVNLLVIQRFPTNSAFQLVTAAGSVALIAVSAALAAFSGDGWLPAIACWTFSGIAWRLASPSSGVEHRFDPEVRPFANSI